LLVAEEWALSRTRDAEVWAYDRFQEIEGHADAAHSAIVDGLSSRMKNEEKACQDVISALRSPENAARSAFQETDARLRWEEVAERAALREVEVRLRDEELEAAALRAASSDPKTALESFQNDFHIHEQELRATMKSHDEIARVARDDALSEVAARYAEFEDQCLLAIRDHHAQMLSERDAAVETTVRMVQVRAVDECSAEVQGIVAKAKSFRDEVILAKETLVSRGRRPTCKGASPNRTVSSRSYAL
jgi:hypothetical protein